MTLDHTSGVTAATDHSMPTKIQLACQHLWEPDMALSSWSTTRYQCKHCGCWGYRIWPSTGAVKPIVMYKQFDPNKIAVDIAQKEEWRREIVKNRDRIEDEMRRNGRS